MELDEQGSQFSYGFLGPGTGIGIPGAAQGGRNPLDEAAVPIRDHAEGAKVTWLNSVLG